MKLFLSSLNLSQFPEKLIPEFKKLIDTKRSGKQKPQLTTIHNASDWKGSQRSAQIDEEDKVLLDYELEYQRIDLNNYVQDINRLQKVIKASDAAFIGGGNTFLIRYWLKKSGIELKAGELL